ncbi:hypothetical protein WR25_18707 [Diploscapter pachys]|uniref:Uncharacterized protein n=1 Tax=Diploscapter pachys TaxID=2018661 RepID=A0A2A2KFV6_9BILA|nr:hypothetical protein WR25_18707 [Diploscapter pachys]
MCNFLLGVLAIFAPPLAVLCKSGCNADFWINLILTLCFFVPGMVHAWYVICCKEDPGPIQTTVHVHTSGYAPAPTYA